LISFQPLSLLVFNLITNNEFARNHTDLYPMSYTE